jgi:hypothetical protein
MMLQPAAQSCSADGGVCSRTSDEVFIGMACTWQSCQVGYSSCIEKCLWQLLKQQQQQQLPVQLQ